MNIYNHYLNKKKMFLGILFVLSTVQVGAQAFRDEVEDSLKAFSVPPFYCKTLMTPTLNDTRGVGVMQPN